MKNLIIWLLFLICAASSQAQEGNGHFLFSGQLNQLLSDGARIAPVTSGLPFAILISENGARVSPAQFDLKIPNAAGPVKLEFENLKFTDGRLTGAAKVTNATGAVIEGVRLDVVSVNEDYKTKGTNGVETLLKSRAQPFKLASPLFFGDFAKGDVADSIAFNVSNLKLGVETSKVTVGGVVSGLLHLSKVMLPESTLYNMDTDMQ